MAQQVKIAGALFENVPSISAPDANDVWHAFTDTSDADAVAADIASGKTAYVGGVKLVGTGEPVQVEPLSVAENGVYTAPTGTAFSPVTVNVEGGGGGGGSMSDPIRFFDYDGTLVASYSSVPSELPDVPTHDGLVDGTWNYTLAEVGEQFAAMGTCDVGANYSTESGATEIDVVLDSETLLNPYITFAINGTVSINWGDGITETYTGTSLTTYKRLTHQYSATGTYTISIKATSGEYALYNNGTYLLLNLNNSSVAINRIAVNSVKAVRIGDSCSIGDNGLYGCSIDSITIPANMPSGTIGNNAFDDMTVRFISIPHGTTVLGNNVFTTCRLLSNVSIPVGVSSVGNSLFLGCCSFDSFSVPHDWTAIPKTTFSNCYLLQSIAVPNGSTSIGASAFNNCYSLGSISIPDSVTVINSGAFNNCESVRSIVIPHGVSTIESSTFNGNRRIKRLDVPASVSSIGNGAFNGCNGVSEFHFASTTPPTLNTMFPGNYSKGAMIYVPYSADHSVLEAYKTATNWSSYASRIVEEPQS